MRRSSILSLFLLTLLIAGTSSNAQEEDKQIVRGKIVCVQLDEDGMAQVQKDFTECTGLLYLLGVNGQLYSVHGSEEEIESIKQGSKSKMGYRVPLRLKGKTVGHERAWQMYTPSLELDNSSVRTTVTGSVLCVFPNYKDGTVDPKIAGGPCNEAEPHAHLIKTEEGQIYAIHGPAQSISSIETNPNKKEVTVSGVLKANESGWILYVN